MPEPHVLVGGVGFLGVNLAKTLAERGVGPIVVVARKSSLERRRVLAKVLEDLGVELRVVDSVGPGHVKGAETIYHLAGKPGGSLDVNMESHVRLLEREIEGAAETGSRVVYVSSIAVPADAAPSPPGSLVAEEEEHLWGLQEDGFERVFMTHHSYTKALGERLLLGADARLGGRWAIVRPALVFGPYAYHPEWRMMRLAAKLRLAPKSKRVPVVNVLDVAEILADAGEGRLDGAWVNAVAPRYSLSDVAEAVCRAVHGGRCLGVPADPLLSLGRLAPRGSPQRLAWSIVRRRYQYSSRILAGREWRLEPAI